MALRKAWVSASVLDISMEKISEAAIMEKGVSSPRARAMPIAIAVLPVPGCPASSTPRPAILPSLIIWVITPAACRHERTPQQQCESRKSTDQRTASTWDAGAAGSRGGGAAATPDASVRCGRWAHTRCPTALCTQLPGRPHHAAARPHPPGGRLPHQPLRRRPRLQRVVQPQPADVRVGAHPLDAGEILDLHVHPDVSHAAPSAESARPRDF